MKDILQFDAVFWDFDGVLMNSNAVRDVGFEKVLAHYPPAQVSALLDYHRANGGLSRYVKFRYFFEIILKESITEEQVNFLAKQFSEVMLELLLDEKLLIHETLDFVKSNHEGVPMHIVSGSDQNELRFICNTLDIAKFFISIHGSPQAKIKWVDEIIQEQQYDRNRCLLIGDSINDFEAATFNKIDFYAYNNPAITDKSTLELTWFNKR